MYVQHIREERLLVYSVPIDDCHMYGGLFIASNSTQCDSICELPLRRELFKNKRRYTSPHEDRARRVRASQGIEPAAGGIREGKSRIKSFNREVRGR